MFAHLENKHHSGKIISREVCCPKLNRIQILGGLFNVLHSLDSQFILGLEDKVKHQSNNSLDKVRRWSLRFEKS
jgi:hypothetical protein